MQQTDKLGLRLPETTDKFDVDDLNYNFDKLDDALMPDEDDAVDLDGAELDLKKNVTDQNAFYARLRYDEDYDAVVLSRESYTRYDPGKVDEVRIYEEENSEEVLEGIVKISARDRIILETQAGTTLEINSDGVFVNDKKLGGGVSGIGSPVGMINGISANTVGTLTEVV